MERNRTSEDQQPTEEAFAPIEEHQPQDESPKEEVPEGPDIVLKAFEDKKSKPDQTQIDAWKQQFGEVFLIAFDEDDMYVWRPINRLEYKQMIQNVQSEAAFQEGIVQQCVLWPTIGPEWLSAGKAGTIPTLHAVIMEGSNFLEPAMAVTLVRKL